MPTYYEREIARVQIDAAIEQYERENFIEAITLAGAAEDILTGLLRKAGKMVERSTDDLDRFTPSLDSLANAAVEIQQQMEGLALSAKERKALREDFVQRANRARNALKHHTSKVGDTIEIEDLEEEATDMLDRATSNYWALMLEETPAMRRYLAVRLGGYQDRLEAGWREARTAW